MMFLTQSGQFLPELSEDNMFLGPILPVPTPPTDRFRRKYQFSRLDYAGLLLLLPRNKAKIKAVCSVHESTYIGDRNIYVLILLNR